MHAGYLRALKLTYDTSLVYRGSEGEADWTPIGAPTLKVKSAVPSWSGAPERTFELDLPTYEGYGGTIWMRNWLQRFVDDIRAGRSRLDRRRRLARPPVHRRGLRVIQDREAGRGEVWGLGRKA